MRGDFNFDDEDDQRPARRPAASARPARRAAPITPILIVAVAGGGFLFLAAVVVAILVVRKASREAEPAAAASGPAAATVPAISGPRPPSTVLPKKDPDPATGSPTPEVVEKVKRATVRVRVLFPGRKAGSGTGFVESGTQKVLTNAHVMGLVAQKGERKLGPPLAIELIINSGEPGKEYALGGELEAVDTESDLAILRPYLLNPDPKYTVPPGLVVPKAPNVTLLQRLFVFGYPFGEQLGTEITVSETSVSSLRKDPATGRLSLIQVRGGMNPGNSGGPVVDVKGNVVGVAVAGIQGTDINFAIPGEVVQEFLSKKR